MPRDALVTLAQLFGVQTSYFDTRGRLVEAGIEPLLAVLRELGAELAHPGEAADACRRRRQGLWREVLPKAQVRWREAPGGVRLRLAADEAAGAFACRLHSEDGQERRWTGRLEDLPVRRGASVEGVPYVRTALPLPDDLPAGYHHLDVDCGGRTHGTMVIVAPGRAFAPPPRRVWGLFLPVHALHRQGSWGAGDLGDFKALLDWTADHGGSVVGCLPLLARAWELGGDVSPYSPMSRLFFDEFYIDVAVAAEMSECRAALELMRSDEFQAAVRGLWSADLVDYRRQMTLKRRVLEILSDWFFAEAPDRSDFERFLREVPDAERFARFRAVCRRQGRPWGQWPEALRNGHLRPEDYSQRDVRYFLFTQWQVRRQLQAVARRADERGVSVYLDLPLGSSPDGYDLWAWRDSFAAGMAMGAPPDDFHPGGQNWGLAPLHPRRLRDHQYAYFRAIVAAQLDLAGMLRLDHVMGLHRLFWIPSGMAAAQGVYVHSCAEELLAVLTVESHRRQVVLVGENLGTVPDTVGRSMDRHGLMGMYVLPFEIRPGADPPVRPPRADHLASLNTHDMPPFAGFWQDADVEARRAAGELADDNVGAEHDRRDSLRRALLEALGGLGLHPAADDLSAVLDACLELLGRSAARVVLVNVEDLWLETQEQNRPGVDDPANWRSRARHRLEEFDALDAVAGRLRRLAAARDAPVARRGGG
ncbi:MAG: 4-alpha-glucanotransferase [Planctomycetes bacterium]|nr:4-alpha-glucanotransferase [Planctomycetota bacterium]